MSGEWPAHATAPLIDQYKPVGDDGSDKANPLSFDEEVRHLNGGLAQERCGDYTPL